MKILVKGAGDLATGIGWRLKRAGYRVWMTDLEVPTAVRRTVAFSRAIYEGEARVEGILSCRVSDMKEAEEAEKSRKDSRICRPGGRNPGAVAARSGG